MKECPRDFRLPFTKEGEKKERKFMKKYKIWIMTAILLLFGGAFFYSVRSEAATVTYTDSEIGTLDDIGTYQNKEGGYSHVGVKLYWDDKLVAYAVDTYRKESGSWFYLATNYNGVAACLF